MATPEPEFVVEKKYDGFEVRAYPALVVAETAIEGDMDQAGSEGFRRLFEYISGANQGSRKIAMTAPVIQAAATSSRAFDASKGYTVQFVMPAGATVDSLPAPADARVTLRALPAMPVAVLVYAGRWTEANYQEHLSRLREGMKRADLQAAGPAALSRYDPPFMPFFWRRNEIWLPLAATHR